MDNGGHSFSQSEVKDDAGQNIDAFIPVDTTPLGGALSDGIPDEMLSETFGASIDISHEIISAPPTETANDEKIDVTTEASSDGNIDVTAEASTDESIDVTTEATTEGTNDAATEAAPEGTIDVTTKTTSEETIDVPAEVQTAEVGNIETKEEEKKQKVGAEGENDDLKLVEFKCPNCGGIVYSVKNSIDDFCSYCGSKVMLQSGSANMKQPKGVIPFKIDKDKCRSIYENKVKKLFFVPSEFKDPQYCERFRSIYMPYLVFDVDVKGPLNLSGKRKYCRGDYEYTEICNCHANMDCYYHGISLDASSAFDDNMSEAIGPFDSNEIVPFEASYLKEGSVFKQDVGYECYEYKVKTFVLNETFNSAFSGWERGVVLDEHQEGKIPILIKPENIYTALFPVWLMTYKFGDRIGRVAINGQTGKISYDMPVSIKEYVIFCLKLAIPVYLLFLFAVPTMYPSNLIAYIHILGCLSAFLVLFNVSAIVKKEQHLDDDGYYYEDSSPKIFFTNKWRQIEEKQKKKIEKEMNNTLAAGSILTASALCIVQFIVLILKLTTDAIALDVIHLNIVQSTIIEGLMWAAFVKAKELEEPDIVYEGGIPLVVAAPLAILLSGNAPVSNSLYYVSAIVIAIGVIITLVLIAGMKSLLYTRPMPQTEIERGDTNESA